MLGIIIVLKKWKPFLYSTIELFKVVIDYKNLIELLITKELNYKQVKWIEKLIKYYFKIKYIKRTKNAKVNILSRKVKL